MAARKVAKSGGRPVGTTNTTGWRQATVNLRPLGMDEVDRQAKRAKVSRSAWIQRLVADELGRLGKGKLLERADKKSFKGDSA